MGEHTKEPTWRRRGLISMAVLSAAAVALWAVNFMIRDPACAVTEPERKGRAYLYETGPGDGNCSLGGAVTGGTFVSVSTEEYAGSRACGTYLDVTGPRGTVRAQVVDRCPGCGAGELDLNRAVFERIQDPARGVAPVTYRTVRNPRPARKLAFRVKPGSSAAWTAVQVIGHGNPLRLVEVRDGDAWRDLARGSDGYWVTARGVGAGRFDLRVSDVYGHRRTARDLKVAPGRIQRTSVKMYGEPKASPEPRTTPSPATAQPSPSAVRSTPVIRHESAAPAPARPPRPHC